jgi:hypothetical protein
MRTQYLNLQNIICDTINHWGDHTAYVDRTNIIVQKKGWHSKFSGFVQPADTSNGKITIDAAAFKHVKTERAYFVDVARGLMIWGPRKYIHECINRNIYSIDVNNLTKLPRKFNYSWVPHKLISTMFKATDVKSNPVESANLKAEIEPAVNKTNVSSDTPPIASEHEKKESSNMKKVINRIWVTFEKEGVHKYPAALTDPKLATGGWDDVSFLGYPHRHTFKFRVEIEVFHDDRDIEFIQFKRWLERLYNDGTLQLDYRSCEMISDELATKINDMYPGRKIVIEVSEDGENGAHSVYVPE